MNVRLSKPKNIETKGEVMTNSKFIQGVFTQVNSPTSHKRNLDQLL